MAITQRGEDTFFVRVYVGRDPLTKKRIEVNETVRGTIALARKREAQLKAQKHSGRLLKPSRMTIDELFDRYLESARHTLSATTHHKYNVLYHKYVSPYIGNTSIAKINRSDIQGLFNFLLDPKEENDNGKEGL